MDGGGRQAELDIAAERRAYDARIARAHIDRGIADQGDREAIAREIAYTECPICHVPMREHASE